VPNPDIGSGSSHNILSGYDAFPEFGRDDEAARNDTLLSGAAMNEWVNKGAHADFL